MFNHMLKRNTKNRIGADGGLIKGKQEIKRKEDERERKTKRNIYLDKKKEKEKIENKIKARYYGIKNSRFHLRFKLNRPVTIKKLKF